MSEAVLFAELDAGQHKLGRVTLNAEATLNSLSLEMVDLLQAQLDAWANDPAIAAIFMDAAGEKAFCAGGDIQALHASVTETPGGPCEYAEAFFEREYRLDYTLHTYAKPVVCWGHGIIMGGGMGVVAGCSHRIATERTHIAMPEVSIALFPDVGGSWFLNRAPGRSGEFLGLTGAAMNAADAIFVGIADRFIASEHKQAVIDALLDQTWSDEAEANHALVHDALRPFSEQSLGSRPAGRVEPHLESINALMDGDDVHMIIDRITGQDTDDPWLANAGASLDYGSKLAALWTHRQLQESRHRSLKEVFQSELRLATQILRHPEFAEGVRALIIDKDREPAWLYANSRDVPADVLDGFFAEPWSENPLADLK